MPDTPQVFLTRHEAEVLTIARQVAIDVRARASREGYRGAEGSRGFELGMIAQALEVVEDACFDALVIAKVRLDCPNGANAIARTFGEVIPFPEFAGVSRHTLAPVPDARPEASPEVPA